MSDGSVNEDDRSRVAFLNEFDSDASPEQVRDAIRERFNLGEAALARLFAGPPLVIKSNVDAETALRFKLAVEATGAKCRIEPMPVENDTDEQGYLERRRGERRQCPDRRSTPRTLAISPDRRLGDRRGSGAGEG